MIDIFNVVLVLSVIIIRIYCKKTVQLHAATKIKALHLIIRALPSPPLKLCQMPPLPLAPHTIPSSHMRFHHRHSPLLAFIATTTLLAFITTNEVSLHALPPPLLAAYLLSPPPPISPCIPSPPCRCFPSNPPVAPHTLLK